MSGNSGKLIWSNVNPAQFLNASANIGVTWLKTFGQTDTSVREANISVDLEWKGFAKNCFLPWYKDGDWWTPDIENWSLIDQARQSPLQLKQTSNLLVLSAYHTLLGKRIVVDGCHRAVAIQTLIGTGKTIPSVRVLECYGTQIHAIFPCDFCSLIVDALRRK